MKDWTAQVYLGERYADATPQPVMVSWPELVAKIRAGARHRAKNGPYFMVCTLTGARRCNDNVGDVHLVALDIEKQDIPDVDELLDKLPYKGLAYSTWRHGVRGDNGTDWKPGQPRCRIVFPLERTLTPRQYKCLLRWFEDYLGVEIDSTNHSAAQLYTTCRGKNPDAVVEPWVKVMESEQLFDPLDLPDASSLGEYEAPQMDEKTRPGKSTASRPPKRSRQMSRPCRSPRRPNLTLYDLERVRDALRVVPAEDYHTWIAVGMALHDWAGGESIGLALFRWYSSKCAEKYDPRECAEKWATFNRDGKGGYTVATIIHLAKENGWVNSAFRPELGVFTTGTPSEAADKVIEHFASQNKTITRNFGDLLLVDQATGQVETLSEPRLRKLIRSFETRWLRRVNRRPRRMRISKRFESDTIRNLRGRFPDPRDAVEPRAVTEADKLVSRFLDASTSPAKGSYVGELHERFVEWCEEHGHEPFSIQNLGECLSRLGVRRGRDKGGIYCGLRVNNQ